MLSVAQQAHTRGGPLTVSVMLTLHTPLVCTTSKHVNGLADVMIAHAVGDVMG